MELPSAPSCAGANGTLFLEQPHWTCVEHIGERTIHLLDSDEYEQVRRSATGIRPEPGWEIEDCFLLTRQESTGMPRQKELFEPM